MEWGLIAGGLVLASLAPFAKRGANYVINALAASIVHSINGQLGLDDIRTRICNIERQMEAILADLD